MKRRLGSLSLMVAALLLSAACGDESDTSGPGGSGGGDGGSAGQAPEIAWYACPIFTGEAGDEAECADVAVPLDWSDPASSKTISLFVKRILGSAEPRRQLWPLAGGPGSAGVAFEEAAAEWSAGDPSLDIYLLDHRGTGRSAKLDCNPYQSSAACISWLEDNIGAADLRHYSITNAARDLGALIAWTRQPDQAVIVLGASYGTLLGQRYLQLYPEQAAGVVLDGLLQQSTSLEWLFKLDTWQDVIGRRLLQACGADPFCAAKVGPDPEALLAAALGTLGAGSCPGLPTLPARTARALMAILAEDFELRALVPAVAYRVARCEAGDAAAVNHLIQTLTEPAPPTPQDELRSHALNAHILLSELSPAQVPSLADIEAATADTLFGYGQDQVFRLLYDGWPRYLPDEHAGQYPDTGVPMLLLNGTLDARTPIDLAEPIAGHYTEPGQTFVAVPRGGHTTIRQSPTTAGDTCGGRLFLGFLADPGAPVDDSCTAEVLPLAFEGDQQLAQALMGTDDIWENGAQSAATGSSQAAARARDRARRALRQHQPEIAAK